MPELPEVETIVRQLDKVLPGKVIEKVEVLREKSFIGDENWLRGKKILRVGRKAKMIIVEIDDTDKLLIGHLKMTGQLLYSDKKKGQNELPKHTRVVMNFKGGQKLFFNDMRVFGWLKIVSNKWWEETKSKLPPDVIDNEFSSEYLETIIGKSKKAIKLFLLDQTKIGGMGNIYVCDALYKAGILPTREASSLSKKKISSLAVSVKDVIYKGIKYGGASAKDENFRNILGKGGRYQNYFLVYERNGKKCVRCGEIIKKIKLGGRGTYYCPKCQK